MPCEFRVFPCFQILRPTLLWERQHCPMEHSASVSQPCEVHPWRAHVDLFIPCARHVVDSCTVLTQIRHTHRSRPEHPHTTWIQRGRLSTLDGLVFRPLYPWSCCPLTLSAPVLSREPPHVADLHPTICLHRHVPHTPVQHHCFLFLVAISNLSNEFRCVHGLQLVASPSTPKSSPRTSNLASSFSQKSTAGLDRPAAYPWVIVLPPVACVFSSIHGTSQTHHVAFGFHGVFHRELHKHIGVTELSTKGFVLLVKRCGDCPSLRLTGTRCQFSPCAGEEHGEGLGKSLLNRVLHVEAHAEKCGSCRGQLSPCGGRRPSPRSHTFRSVGSCAGRLERTKDIQTWNPCCWD